MTSGKRAADDALRLQWILTQVKGAGTVIDVAGPDTPLVKLVRSQAGANGNGKPVDWADVALCCDLLQTLTAGKCESILGNVRATTLIVTVPNRASKSYRKDKRDRSKAPGAIRLFSALTLRTCLDKSRWYVIRRVEPIVGTLSDSIWLGAVCHRR